MAFRNIGVALTATDAGLTSTIRRASTTVDQFGQRVDHSGKLVNTTTAGMGRGFTNLDSIISRGVNRSLTGFVVAATGGYAAGRALNAGFQAVIGGAVQFDARMRNVNSIAHLSEAQLHSLGNEVLDLSAHLPQSANTLAQGLYDIQSSGFAGTAGLIVLNQSARAASAGLTDTATAAQAVDGVLNAYGKQASDAQSVSDSLFQTVNVGVLSFGDLAQGIGQVVGTAAAANVSINDVGAAIATMTRAGLVPAESFTSLNQLLAQIIQPSEALAGVFHQLGYESGAAALGSKGLFGVMQDIRHVTGGNITAMSELFTDTRSLRGAMDLVANGGKLYADSQRQMAEATKGNGATQAAFEEQQKGVAFQWQMLKNEAQRAAISAGTEVLPELISLMHGVEALGHVLSNEGVQSFLLVAGAAYTLNKALNASAAIRGSTLFSAVGRQIGASSAATGAITAEGVAATRTSAALGELALAENTAAVAAGRLAAASVGASEGSVIGAGLAANVPGRGAIAGTAIRGLAKASIVGLAGVASYDLTTSLLHGIFGSRFGADPPDPNDPETFLAGLNSTGQDQIRPLIEQYGSLDTALKVLKETNAETAASQKDLGISHKITTGDLEAELAALQALQQQRAEFTSQVQASFFGAVDVTQQFDPASGQQAIDAAQQRLIDAQRSLRQEEARTSAGKGKPTVSEEQQLADARRNVAGATQDLADAQREAAKTGDLSTIYQNNISLARTFLQNVREAEQRGLDPEFISRTLKEGPEKAGPILDAIVSDHSNRMIELANTNERVLRRIGAQTVRYAQFVNRAVNAPLEDQARLARELPHALDLDRLMRNMQAPSTGHWLAEQLGMTPKEIRRLAEDFGITLPAFVQRTLNKHPVHVKVNFNMPPGYTSGPNGIHIPHGAAEGWHVQGPGTSTSDSILARVSKGEYIVRAAAVNHYGLSTVDAMNKMRLPRFAEGGMWGTARPITASSAGAQVIVQPVIVRESVSHVTRIDRASFDDSRAFDTFQQRQRRRRAVQV